MNFKAPAQYTDHLFHDHSAEKVKNAAIAAVGELCWTVSSSGAAHLAARTPFNLLTGGEEVQLDFTLEGTLRATSRNYRTGTFFDLGKNRKNIDALFRVLEKRI